MRQSQPANAANAETRMDIHGEPARRVAIDMALAVRELSVKIRGGGVTPASNRDINLLRRIVDNAAQRPWLWAPDRGSGQIEISTDPNGDGRLLTIRLSAGCIKSRSEA